MSASSEKKARKQIRTLITEKEEELRAKALMDISENHQLALNIHYFAINRLPVWNLQCLVLRLKHAWRMLDGSRQLNFSGMFKK
ncbi:MAG: hypothetical protein R8M45_01935 [Ghiorsea sp.]